MTTTRSSFDDLIDNNALKQMDALQNMGIDPSKDQSSPVDNQPENNINQRPIPQNRSMSYLDLVRQELQRPKTGLIDRFEAGALDSIVKAARKLPGLGDLGDSFKQINSPAEQAQYERLFPKTGNRPIDKLDAYALLNVKPAEHWYTPGGLAEGFGSFLPFSSSATNVEKLFANPAIQKLLAKTPNLVQRAVNWSAPKMGSGALYGMGTNENPGEGAITGALGGLAGGAIGGALGYGAPVVKRAINYLQPGKAASQFLETMGGNKTAEENAAELARRIHYAYNVNKSQALAPKQEVLSTVGGKNIYKNPDSTLPEGNLHKVATLIDSTADITNKNEMQALAKALMEYRKTGDVIKFVDTGEDIFKPKEDITQAKIDKIEDLLSIPTMKNPQYLKNPDLFDVYSGKVKDLHDAFLKKPNFRASDNLQAQLGEEIGRLGRMAKKDRLDPAGKRELDTYKKARDSLINDQENFLAEYPELKDKYAEFKRLWREEVVPYHADDDVLTDIAKNGTTQGVTPSDIKRIFSFPTKGVSKVLQDVGPSINNNVLFNEFQKLNPTDAKALVKALMEAKKFKGYQSYVTPEMEGLQAQLEKQLKARNAALSIASLGLGGATGHPYLGAVGSTLPYLSEPAKKLVAALVKRK